MSVGRRLPRVSLLSRVGIGDGGATVDLVVPELVTAGATVDARVDVSGGTSDREVEAVYAALRTRYDTGEERRAVTVAEYTLVDGLTAVAGEERSFDVDLPVPHATPVTASADVWIDTALDIDWATDPTDTDPVDVDPGPRLGTLLDAVEGLRLHRKFSESVPAAATPLADHAGDLPFVQTFVYDPAGSGPAAGVGELLAVLVHPGEDRLYAHLVPDRPERPVTEWPADGGVDVEVGPDDDAEAVAERVRAAVERLI